MPTCGDNCTRGYGLVRWDNDVDVAAGMALASLRDGATWRTFCVWQRWRELNEGSNWEAIVIFEHFHLENLIAIVNTTRFRHSGRGGVTHCLNVFSWGVVELDGQRPHAEWGAAAEGPSNGCHSERQGCLLHLAHGATWDRAARSRAGRDRGRRVRTETIDALTDYAHGHAADGRFGLLPFAGKGRGRDEGARAQRGARGSGWVVLYCIANFDLRCLATTAVTMFATMTSR